MRYQIKMGFTLAELLIALAILGVIATFTIPKVLSNQADAKKKAVYRETLATLSDIVYQGQITGALGDGNFDTYLFSKVNGYKLCQSDADTEGCWSHATPGGGNPKVGFVLHSGATVAGIGDGSGSGPEYRDSFYVDWNGAALPNTEGDDQIRVRACWGQGSCSAGQRVGTLAPEPGFASSASLYSTVFSN